MESILDFLNNQFNKIHSEIKGVKIYKPDIEYIDLQKELIIRAESEDEKEDISENFPSDIGSLYEIIEVLEFRWTKPMASNLVDLSILDFNLDKYFITIFQDGEDSPGKIIAAFNKGDLKQALRIFLDEFFSNAGKEYIKNGIWGTDASYIPNKRNIRTDLIDEEFMDKCYAKCMNALGKGDDGNKVILTQVTPKMSRDEVYESLVKNLKKQGIEVKPNKKK